MGLHIELNSWTQAEDHFREVDQDQGREYVDRETGPNADDPAA